MISQPAHELRRVPQTGAEKAPQCTTLPCAVCLALGDECTPPPPQCRQKPLQLERAGPLCLLRTLCYQGTNPGKPAGGTRSGRQPALHLQPSEWGHARPGGPSGPSGPTCWLWLRGQVQATAYVSDSRNCALSNTVVVSQWILRWLATQQRIIAGAPQHEGRLTAVIAGLWNKKWLKYNRSLATAHTTRARKFQVGARWLFRTRSLRDPGRVSATFYV